MNNKGEIIACDIHESRINLVKENAKRLGINIIKTKIENAMLFKEEYMGKFDKILIDVPCLGIGVLKRKPDIKWQREKEDIEEITKIQFQILDNCAKYLKIGGELVYSTCSILKDENEKIIQKWMEQVSLNYEIKGKEKILPSENSDGFFMCKIRKIN